MKRVLLQPAYVLHRRPYRETSFLVELFTQEHGRISAVARGVRKAKSSTIGLLRQFVPVLISWMGNGELVTITQIEANGTAMALQGECLFAGFYLNELFMCLLQKHDPHPALFRLYETTMQALQQMPLQQGVLRRFEKQLLQELGYGFLPTNIVEIEQTFHPDYFYRFVPEQGFIRSEIGEYSQEKVNIFSGKNLLAIAKEDWQNEDGLQDAKRLIRLVLIPLLGSRQINSRKLFMECVD